MTGFKTIEYLSATGTGTIQARLYLPADLTKATGLLLQIVHGMAEHMARYDSFCRFLSENGLAVCIHDQAGHGRSAQSPDDLGFFGVENRVKTVQEDIDLLAELALKILVEKSNDQIRWRRALLGHSMGSFISRLYCAKPDPGLAGAIFSGTSGTNPAVKLGVFLSRRSVRKNGPRYKDEFLAKLSSMGNLKRIPQARTAFDWLTRDQAIVDAYIADPWCGYTFTAAGYRDLFTWLQMISRREWAANVPVSLPILLISGSGDPISQYGRGPRQVQQRLLAAGHRTDMKIYPGCRHEVLNETNRLMVWQDVLDWLIALPVLQEKGSI
jgi:alpha-beta hydrolase superfamily lysophospholipase